MSNRLMSGTAVAPGDSRLADRLRREIRGDVLFSRADRGRYATDASIYQVRADRRDRAGGRSATSPRRWPSRARKASPCCRAAAARASAARP